jgi:hypothetical protein
MKTLREMMDLIKSAQVEEPVEEGIKSALAGAALAGSLAMNPAQAQEPPSWQDQVMAAMKAGDIPQASNVKLTRQAGWVTSVTINGRTYDISHRIPQQQKQSMDKLSDVGSLMQK